MNKNGTPQNLVPGKRVGRETLGRAVSVRFPQSWYEQLDRFPDLQGFIREAVQEKLERMEEG